MVDARAVTRGIAESLATGTLGPPAAKRPQIGTLARRPSLPAIPDHFGYVLAAQLLSPTGSMAHLRRLLRAGRVHIEHLGSSYLRPVILRTEIEAVLGHALTSDEVIKAQSVVTARRDKYRKAKPLEGKAIGDGPTA